MALNYRRNRRVPVGLRLHKVALSTVAILPSELTICACDGQVFLMPVGKSSLHYQPLAVTRANEFNGSRQNFDFCKCRLRVGYGLAAGSGGLAGVLVFGFGFW